MRRRSTPKYRNHGNNPIAEEGDYNLKWVCDCCGETIRLTTNIIIIDGVACHPCDCDGTNHLTPVENKYFYEKVN